MRTKIAEINHGGCRPRRLPENARYLCNMNYLAHAWLSFHDPEIMVGNLISDYVKGKKQFTYSPRIQQGLRLHRAIDQFTDAHAATRLASEFFRPSYGRYSSAFIDIVYDHFLATDPTQFPGDELERFSQKVYQTITPYAAVFPEKFARFFPFMKMQNWLYNYQFRWGIRNSFEGLVRRATYLQASEEAYLQFELHYHQLQHHYAAFFPDVHRFAKDWLAAEQGLSPETA